MRHSIGNEKIKELKRKAHSLEPVVRLGKNGLTDKAIQEIDKNLNKQELLKIRLLRSLDLEGNERKRFAEIVSEKTGSILIGLIGSVLILYRQKSAKKGPRPK